MSVDVNAVNERLNGLVNLLNAVGVDSLRAGVNKVGGDLAIKSDTTGTTASTSGSGFGAGDSGSQLNDDQIEAIIKKLQIAQNEAPQIIAALEAHAEAKSLNGSTGNKQGESEPGSSHSKKNAQALHQSQQQKPEDDGPAEEDENDDGNFPLVGPGCSDDISIVSDLTTPTVVSSLNVADEEHYSEAMPPMIVGGGGGGAKNNIPPMLIQQTKRKNLVNQIQARGGYGGLQGSRRNQLGRSSGGAAASRRKNYQETMNKLQQKQRNNPSHRTGLAGPSRASSNSNAIKGTSPRRSNNANNQQRNIKPTKSLAKPSPKNRQSSNMASFSSNSANVSKKAMRRRSVAHDSGYFGSTKQQQFFPQDNDGWGFNTFESKDSRISNHSNGRADGTGIFDPFGTGWSASSGDLVSTGGSVGSSRSSSRSKTKSSSGFFPNPDPFGTPSSNSTHRRSVGRGGTNAQTHPPRRSRKEGGERRVTRSSSKGSTGSSEHRRPRRSRRASLAM